MREPGREGSKGGEGAREGRVMGCMLQENISLHKWKVTTNL